MTDLSATLDFLLPLRAYFGQGWVQMRWDSGLQRLVVTPSGDLYTHDPYSGASLLVAEPWSDQTDMSLSADGRTALVGVSLVYGQPSHAYQVDLTTGASQTLSIEGYYNALTLTADHTALGGTAGQVVEMTLGPDALTPGATPIWTDYYPGYPGPGPFIPDMTASEHGRYVLIRADVEAGVYVGNPPHPQDGPGQLALYDTASQQIVALNRTAFPAGSDPSRLAQGAGDDVSEAAGLAAVVVGGHVRVFDLALNLVTTLGDPDQTFYGAHFTPDGRQLLAFDANHNTLVAFDVQSWSSVGSITLGPAADSQYILSGAAEVGGNSFGEMAVSDDGRFAFVFDRAQLTGHILQVDLASRLSLTVVADDNHHQLFGGIGDDTLVSGPGDDTLDGAQGEDAASYALATAGVVVDLSLQGQAQDTVGAGHDHLTGIEDLIGSAFNDTLTGDSGANVLDGGVGGVDWLDGGLGVDTASFASSSGPVTVSLAQQGSVQHAGSGLDVHLANFENLRGSAFADTLTGDAGANVIEGGLGDDRLDGGGGVDTVSYAHAASGVTVSLALQGTAQDTVGAGRDTLSNFANVTGSTHDDILAGDAGDNVIDGGGGNDTVSYADVTGGIGVRIRLALNGSSQDTFSAGHDTLLDIHNVIGTAYDDTLSGDDGDNILDGAGGLNTVDYGDAHAGVRVFTFQPFNSNGDVPQDTGGAGHDTLYHIQNLLGSPFDDILGGDYGDNVLAGQGGVNTVSYEAAQSGVTVDLRLDGQAQNTGSGGGVDTLINFQNLIGSSSADTLYGDAHDNVIYGLGGDDVIDGEGGVNTIAFDYGGNDPTANLRAVNVDLALQGVAQDTGAGLKTLRNFQNLTGSTLNDTLAGDGQDNVITGGSGADTFVLRPGGGNDTLTDFSRADRDRLDIRAFTDVHTMAQLLPLAAQSGSDTVLSLPGGGSVTLHDVDLSTLKAVDFVGLVLPGADIYGAGASNILFQNNGQLAVWSLNGTALSGAFVPTVAAGWVAQDTGDFNGDGMSGDVFFRNPATGQSAIWDMSGTQIVGSALLPTAPTSWQVQGTGDFNGDGMSDVLWRDGASGSVAIWEMNGTQIQSSAIVTAVSSDWHAVGVADFNGDGMADMLWKDAATGQVAVWEMNGTQITSAAIAVTAPTSWHVAGTGDFDGDGKADILLRDQASGAVAIWEMDGLALKAAAIVTTVSADWQVAGTADVNGDGMTDILWRNSAGQVAVWDMHGFSIASSSIPGQVAGSWSILNHHYDWV